MSQPTAPSITLRPLTAADLPTLFEQQLDPQANQMAAFTAKDPTDRAAFDSHWVKIMADPGITMRAIIYQGQLAGSIGCHSWFGPLEVTYWLGKAFWGRGIATQALQVFLNEVTTRPLEARVAKDNIASLRVLQKCGFVISGESQGFANARDCDVEEHVLTLEH